MNQPLLSPRLPVPGFFNPEKVRDVWRVSYHEIVDNARSWRNTHSIKPAINDQFKIAFMGIDIQNTFCIPGYELFVGGRSGNGAVEDNVRLCNFLYNNLARISLITLTQDTHFAAQIFHPLFFIDEIGNHPIPYTNITSEEIKQGKWKINHKILPFLNVDLSYMEDYLKYYTVQLEKTGRYSLTIWPYHAMLGGIGHAIVSSVEEAVFFHTIARHSQVKIMQKGSLPLTEHYSAIHTEVLVDHHQEVIGTKDDYIFDMLDTFDIVIITGQAKSHCLAFTLSDIAERLKETNPDQLNKIYILEDCTSPVVVPGGFDFTEQTDFLYKHFSELGIHLVQSITPIEEWPGVSESLSRRN